MDAHVRAFETQATVADVDGEGRFGSWRRCDLDRYRWSWGYRCRARRGRARRGPARECCARSEERKDGAERRVGLDPAHLNSSAGVVAVAVGHERGRVV